MINHLWQTTLFALSAWLLAVGLKRNRAQVRFWLWFSASFKFFVPFSVLMDLGERLHWERVTATVSAHPLPFTVGQIAQPFSDAALFVTPTARGVVDGVFIALVGVWACGFAAIALTRLRNWRRIRSAVRPATPTAMPCIRVPAKVEILSAPGLLEPGVVGILHPILLLPAGIMEHLTPRQMDAILAHELCHIRRRDNLFAAIHMIVEAIFWFHPLVWWIGARLVEERERACDEAVLSQSNEPRVYAHESVCHSVGEYVREQAHTNGVESFWALLKRGYYGIYHHMSVKHLHRYVNEISFRHDTAQAGTMAFIEMTIGRMLNRRLTYKALIHVPA